MPPSTSNVLYVSDLDGTLLQNDATLSPFAQKTLRRLLGEGLPFTFATARSIVSAKQILGDLPLRLPVVCANGAYVCDFASGAHLAVQALAKPMDAALLAFMHAKGFYPFASTFDGQNEALHLAEVANEAIAWYVDDRIKAKDSRLRQIGHMEDILDLHITGYNVMERHGPIHRLKDELRETFGDRIHMYIYENWYSPEWYWLSIHDQEATKANGLKRIMGDRGIMSANLTVFGDQLNDLSMFKLAGTALAMANAHPALKPYASREIGSNEADSVIHYLLAAVAT